MKRLTIDLPDRPYDILIRPGLLDDAGDAICSVLPGAGKLAVVTDSNVGPLYSQRLTTSLVSAGFQVKVISIPAGEPSKSLEMLALLYDEFTRFGLTRSDGVVALGGGVTGDLAGFAAATILRGVPLVQIPTTLLSQVDSSVGGKVAIDLPAGKNLAGTFWQPSLVLMDPSVLNTLPDPVFADGMAEVIKYGCILSAPLFSHLEQWRSREKIMENIEYVLYTCCDLKRSVVVCDERDNGPRRCLNFGHTPGHAYELAGEYQRWTHGQAVSAGMVRMARLGQETGLTPGEDVERIISLLRSFGLPTSIPCTREIYAAAIGLDKKGQGESLHIVLLQEIGKAKMVCTSKSFLVSRL